MSQTRHFIIMQVLAHHLPLYMYLQLNTSILHSKHTKLGNRMTPSLSAEKCHSPSSPLQHNLTFLCKGWMKWENIPLYTIHSLVLPLNEIAYSFLSFLWFYIYTHTHWSHACVFYVPTDKPAFYMPFTLFSIFRFFM